MDLKPIKNTRDYRRALKEIEGLMHAKRNTLAGDRLDVLVVLVEAWEAKHYPLDMSRKRSARMIRFHLSAVAIGSMRCSPVSAH
jgi:HTH-type transcriptional regulator/antitoxin HigA